MNNKEHHKCLWCGKIRYGYQVEREIEERFWESPYCCDECREKREEWEWEIEQNTD